MSGSLCGVLTSEHISDFLVDETNEPDRHRESPPVAAAVKNDGDDTAFDLNNRHIFDERNAVLTWAAHSSLPLSTEQLSKGRDEKARVNPLGVNSFCFRPITERVADRDAA